MPDVTPARYGQLQAAAAALSARQQARRQGGQVSARTIRRDRQRLQALARHPGLRPPDEPAPGPLFASHPLQGPTPDIPPPDPWTAWTNCATFGGSSGARMSNQARWSADDGRVQVNFATRWGGGVPATYEYAVNVDYDTFLDFVSGALGANQTATYSLVKRDGAWAGRGRRIS